MPIKLSWDFPVLPNVVVKKETNKRFYPPQAAVRTTNQRPSSSDWIKARGDARCWVVLRRVIFSGQVRELSAPRATRLLTSDPLFEACLQINGRRNSFKFYENESSDCDT